jgi:hypothetical protein
MANVHDVAAAVLRHIGATSAMKLEKLVYYCQCCTLPAITALCFRRRSRHGGRAP